MIGAEVELDPERSADPVAAAAALERIASSYPAAAERIRADPALRSAVVAVSAASPWLARICTTDPLAVDVLADPRATAPLEGEEDLPRAKNLGLLRIAAQDLLGLTPLEDVGEGLSELAGRLLAAAVDATSSTSADIAVIGMGKLGAQELNYASDIDLMLVTRPGKDVEARPFLQVARKAWKIDLDLRPEGRAGPLARSLDSFEAYWERWAQPWEFQALLKSRPCAGDAEVGDHFARSAEHHVWERPFGAEQLSELRRMKARVEGQVVRQGLAGREIKKGEGGIRDVEFAVQLLQLVHGRSDRSLRERSTLGALAALAAGGYIGTDDALALDSAYRFLRAAEHRLQLYEGQPVYSIPVAPQRREHLARVFGFRDGPAATAAAQFDAELSRHRAAVRSIHERLFFRPLLEVFTAAETSRPSLPEAAVNARLTAFGFTDAARTHQAVAELTRGLTRTSQLMQQMLPILLDWLSESPDPDLGLLGLRTLAGDRHSRARLTEVCRESPAGAQQLCRLLGTGRRFARNFGRHPEALGELAAGTFLVAPSRGGLEHQLARSATWRVGERAAETGLRMFGEREILRVAARDVLDFANVDGTGAALSDIAESIIAAALRQVAPPIPVAVIGMGRFGGKELAYSSDLDLLVVYDLSPGSDPVEAAAAAEDASGSLRRLLGGSTPATGLYQVDFDLRPEGRQGPTARSVDAYALYYERWAQPWERQALLRGRFIAGDGEVGERFDTIARRFVWDRPLRSEDVVEIRRLKARMERERVPADEDPKFHLKLGPGSLSDIEWTVQLLQLEHGVTATGTLTALEGLVADKAVTSADAAVLAEAYRFCERTRNRLALVRDIPGDALPTTGPTLSKLARSLGRSGSELRNEYTRVTRRSRRVVERLFYGRSS